MLISLLMILFVILCFFLALFVLIQQGKGDMGLGSLGGGSQMLFGGSGGQEFFEKITWIMGVIFIFGSLGLSIMKSKQVETSRLGSYTAATKTAEQKIPANLPVPAEKNQKE